MGFWPFGKDKVREGDEDVEFASRVVSSSPRDGTTVRGKLTVHLADAAPASEAKRAADVCAFLAETVFAEASSYEQLVGHEAAVAASVMSRLPPGLPTLRSIEVVAIHMVGDLVPESSSRTASSYPPGSAGLTPPTRASQRSRPRSSPPGSPTSRQSSSQLLAVRSEPLVVGTATPEDIGRALVPLARDATTKLLIGVLRAYDLLVVRQLAIDEADDELLEAIVPISTAPSGLFAKSRADELDRWEGILGAAAIDSLEMESATVVVYLLHQCLDHAKVPMLASASILETIGAGAFGGASSPLASIPRYLHSVDGKPAHALAQAIVDILGEESALDHLDVVLTPVLASLQEDLSLAASQAEASLSFG